jgi:DNA polymerase I-like protein with 3'-5' exonuclease and polymerase domains
MAGADKAVRMYREDPNTDFHNLVVKLTGLDRKRAKDTNFAKAFGAGVPKFALMTGMSLDEAKRTMNQYDEEMPFVSRLAEFCQSRADHKGYLRLIDGARSHFDDWEPRWRNWNRERELILANPSLKVGPCSREEALARVAQEGHPWHGERLRRAFTHKAMNRLIQGSAARQTKMAMRACWQEGLLPLIQLHDELGFSVGEERQVTRASELMRDVVELKVPVMVDAEVGVNWGHAARVEDKNKKVTYGATFQEARAILLQSGEASNG